MPHSPRWYRDRLYVLDSGHGHLSTIDVQSGEVGVVAALPGYARGLAFHGSYAFVGLSKIRESNVFGGLPIAERYDEAERQCGIYVPSISTRAIEVACLRFESGCAELFDVQVLRGMRFPTVVGFKDQTLDGILIAPPTAWLPSSSATAG